MCHQAQASEAGRKAIRHNAPGLARVVGAASPDLARLLGCPPPGSDALLLLMLHTLTGARAAPAKT